MSVIRAVLEPDAAESAAAGPPPTATVQPGPGRSGPGPAPTTAAGAIVVDPTVLESAAAGAGDIAHGLTGVLHDLPPAAARVSAACPGLRVGVALGELCRAWAPSAGALADGYRQLSGRLSGTAVHDRLGDDIAARLMAVAAATFSSTAPGSPPPG